MHQQEEFAVCSMSGGPSLWTVRWDAVDRRLTLFPSRIEIDRAFSLTVQPQGSILLTGLTADGRLHRLVRTGTPDAPDYEVVESVAMPGAELPCRVRVDPTGRTAAIAGYGSGTLTSLALDASGAFAGAPRTVRFAGSGPDPERQEAPHIHDAVFVGSDIWAADLGTDALRVVDAEGLEAGADIRCPAGSGPRHIAELGDGGFVVSGELDSTLLLLVERDRALRVADAVPATSRSIDGPKHPSSVVADRARGIVHLANRGADTVLTAAVEGESLTVLAETATGGVRPEHLALTDGFLFAVHSTDGTLSVLTLRDGVPTGEIAASAMIPGGMWVERLPSGSAS